jgi:diguanylate cyclase (GGDEF)-like protein
MSVEPTTISPPAEASALPGRSLPLPQGWNTLLYLFWTALAWLGDATGLASLQPGTGWVLAAGVLLTTTLFHFLVRQQPADQPVAPSTLVAQSLMGIVWATVYGHFAGGQFLLTTGMYITAVLLTFPAGDLRLLRYLMIAALAAQAISAAMPLPAEAAQPGYLAGALVGTFGLALVFVAMHGLAAWQFRWGVLLQSRNQELAETLERMTRRAERDHLSSAYNRRHIIDMLAREKARADRTGEGFCVCLLDIDHFSAMQEQIGDQAGEHLLASFARRVRGALRSMDVVNANEIPSAFGRIGGEEFIVITPHTALGGALRCAERIRSAVVQRPFNELPPVTASIGIAEYRNGESISSLLGRADKALHAARSGGRNRVHCATADGGRSNVVMPEFKAS